MITIPILSFKSQSIGQRYQYHFFEKNILHFFHVLDHFKYFLKKKIVSVIVVVDGRYHWYRYRWLILWLFKLSVGIGIAELQLTILVSISKSLMPSWRYSICISIGEAQLMILVTISVWLRKNTNIQWYQIWLYFLASDTWYPYRYQYCWDLDNNISTVLGSHQK